jgi:hypothetical protein
VQSGAWADEGDQLASDNEARFIGGLQEGAPQGAFFLSMLMPEGQLSSMLLST